MSAGHVDLMTGRKSGVATRIKEERPVCISIHCMAYRLNLAITQAADAVPEIKQYEQVLSGLFYYFRNSSSRVASLKAILKIPVMDEVNIKEVHEIRWCAFYKAVEAVHRSRNDCFLQREA